MKPLRGSCSKSILFVGLACEDVTIIVSRYPIEDQLIRSLSVSSQRGGDASSSAVVYSLLQRNINININNNDQNNIYFMGTLSTRINSSFIINDLNKYSNINYSLCYFNKNNNASISHIFISKENGSRTIAHQKYEYPLTFNQFKYQINNQLKGIKNLYNKFNLIFFEYKWLKEMTQMIEYIKNNDIHNEILIAIELETIDFWDKEEYDRLYQNNMINKAISISDIIFFSQQYLNEIGYNNDTPIRFLNDMINKYQNNKDQIYVVPWGSIGAYCVQLSNYKHNDIIFSKSHPPPNNTVVDTLGAGDTFNGSFLYAFRQGWNLKNCCDFANKIAGYKVGFHGIDCIKQFTNRFIASKL